MSGSIFVSDQVKEIGTLKTCYTSTLESLGEEPFPDSILSAPVISFGYGMQILHKTVTGANGDHVRTLHNTVMAYVSDDLDAAGISFQGGLGKFTKKHILTMYFFQNLISDHDKQQTAPPGHPP
jgi:hypothetical protein